jgi:ubiquinone/menaquinone biosynthesis C-methylase UbiE
MGFYRDHVVPALIGAVMSSSRLHPFRRRVAGAASGRVLEIGVGAGANLPFYTERATEIFALDPSSRLLARARRKVRDNAPITLIEAGAEKIPLADASIDTLVMTWTACSIPDVGAALVEMRRVLKPCGQLLFVEHGRAPQPDVAKWQHRVEPLWRRISGGCHLSRRIDEELIAAGFSVDRLQTGYIPGPKIMTFLYEGAATPR